MAHRRIRADLPRHPAGWPASSPARSASGAKGREWYEARFLPRIGPLALYGLLFTIVILFALQGDADHLPARWTSPGSRCRCWSTSRSCGPARFALGRALGLAYERTTTLAFTAAGNNFELAIAVAIATFGVTSGQALAGVVGPLIEVPVLVGLVYVALWARGRHYRPTDHGPGGHAHDRPSAAGAVRLRPQRRPLPDGRRLLHHLAGDRIEVRSAGSAPADQVNPAAVAAMAEDRHRHHRRATRRSSPPRPSQASDVVITMGCGDACPIFPGKRYEDWELDDPAGQGVDAVRPIRDEIRARIEALIAEIAPA